MPNCPECNTPEAYVGFTVVECLNPQCRNHACAKQGGHAFVASSPLPPETQAAVDDFMTNDFPGEVESIQNAVGNAIPVTMDFRNVGGDLNAVRMLIRVLRCVRSTLCLRSGQFQEALKAGIQRVAIRHTAPGERKSCTLAHGVLDMIVCFDDQTTHVDPDGKLEYDENDVDRMIADALDLELGPAVRRLQEWLLGCIAEANEALRLKITLDVDWKSFTSHADNRINLQIIDRLEQEMHRHILYWLRSHAANDKAFRKQLKNVLRSVRIEHASSAAQRELFVDGITIVYRLCLTEDGGAWGYELGDVLKSAVMSVQPPPEARDVEEWLASHAPAMQQRIAQVSDATVRSALERFLQTQLPAAALRLQLTARFPVRIDLDWEYLGQNLEILPRLVARVFNRVRGALALVASNESHVSLLQGGAVELIVLSFTDDPAAKSCIFQAAALQLKVCVQQPGTGCFDENEIASILNQRLAVESRLLEAKEKLPELSERLCEKLGTWIDADVAWDGFLAHSDSGALQRTLMGLGDVGFDWVYYALTGQSEESADFKAKLLDRVRAIRFFHAPSAKEKSISADGSTLVYGLFLHEGHDGRFIIDHLKEIFEEIVETMANGAVVSPAVLEELDRCENDILPGVRAKISKALKSDAAVNIDRGSFGNSMKAARRLEDSALNQIAEAIQDLARDDDRRKALAGGLKSITVRHVPEGDGKCDLNDGELIIEICLESGRVSTRDIYDSLKDAFVETAAVDAEDDDAADDAGSEESSTQAPDTNGPVEYFRQFRQQGLDVIVATVNQMAGASIILDGDWDVFEEMLVSDATQNVQMSVFSHPQLFLATIMQLTMTNAPFGQAFKQSVKVIRIACTRPGQAKEIRLERGVLTCRLNPEDGMAGGFGQSEMIARLQSLLIVQ